MWSDDLMAIDPTKLRVSIASPQEILALDYPRLREAARAVLLGEGIRAARISLAFVDDATIHRINKQFLDHDEPTDVVTFPLSNSGAKELQGELVIGVEVAQRQAAERGHDPGVELLLYVIHGVLHLCGYDDRTTPAAQQMRTQERVYLKQLGLPDITGD